MSGCRSHFAEAVIAWQHYHGRHDLPWQIDPSPYRVWVSEVMLQQTQVTTVVPYFQRFMARFPDIPSLAEASPDALLGLWAGLGYYARARHLHQAAGIVAKQWDGQLPVHLEQLTALPGIGRSTAGAILSLGMEQSAPILDGNVKRVLCRVFAIEGWPGQGPVQQRLWRLATRLTPALEARRYNQGMMDLGSLVCTRTTPRCGECPVKRICRACRLGTQTRYPMARPRRPRPVREAWFLLIRHTCRGVLLRRRSPRGVWGGLWSLPECRDASQLGDLCRQLTGHEPQGLDCLPVRIHDFTHYRLRFTVAITVAQTSQIAEDPDLQWFDPTSPPAGLPAPIAKLWQELFPYRLSEIP
ncbi:adenine DNA glycosylase [Gammaproteobacteria bacterium]